MIQLNAKELRTTEVDPNVASSIKKNSITIILDNVLDTYNVGSIFRLADAVAAEKVILCGETLTPPNSRIKKASINTWGWVEWSYAPSAIEAIAQVKSQKSKLLQWSRIEEVNHFTKPTMSFPSLSSSETKRTESQKKFWTWLI